MHWRQVSKLSGFWPLAFEPHGKFGKQLLCLNQATCALIGAFPGFSN